jgi:hypothetical protein
LSALPPAFAELVTFAPIAGGSPMASGETGAP